MGEKEGAMGFYKIILVDDEQEVRNAIAQTLDWESLGFQLIAEANNGSEALELAEQLEPDVIMTDIKMPFMDGLTLARKVQELLPGVRVALFSGFDDFEFAKEAIQLEVVEYILKPIDSVTLSKVFRKLKVSLDEERAEKRNLQQLHQYYEESLPVMRQQLLFQLLYGSIEPANAQEKIYQYDLTLRSPYYVVAALSYDEKALDQQRDLVAFSVRQLMEERFGKEFAFSFVLAPDNMAIIFNLSSKEEVRQIIETLNRTIVPAKKLIGVSLSIGIGNSYPGLEGIALSYEEAVSALDYQVLTAFGQCIFIGDVEPGSLLVSAEVSSHVRDVAQQVKVGSQQSLAKAVDRLAGALSSPEMTMSQYQLFQLELSTELLRICQAYELKMAEELLQELMMERKNFSSLEEVRGWISQQTEQVRQRIHSERKDSSRLLVDKAKQYIGEQYHNSDLSVDQVCGVLNVSSAYFSTLFRQETGLTYISYVTQVRMEKALELLNTTDWKTYQIADAIGYTDANYFSYVFRKEYGMSPTKYRRGKVNLGGRDT